MKKSVLIIWLNTLFIPIITLAQFRNAPANQVGQVLVTACVFEKGISAAERVDLYVLGDDQIADVLSKYVGQYLGSTQLENIRKGSELPATTPHILFLANPRYLNETVSYCQENQVLSITNLPRLVKKGISLGIGIDANGKLGLVMNPKATRAEGKNWNPAIMKIVKVVK